MELLNEEPSSHFYSHRNDIDNTRYQTPTTTLKSIHSNNNDGRAIVDVINRLLPVHTTVSPKPPTTTRFTYQTVGHSDIPRQKNERINEGKTVVDVFNRLLPVHTTSSPNPKSSTPSRFTYQTDIPKQKHEQHKVIPIRNNANKNIYRQRVAFADVPSNKSFEKITTTTTTQSPVGNRRYYTYENFTKNYESDVIKNYKQSGFIKQTYETNITQSKNKELQRKINVTTQRQWITPSFKNDIGIATTSSKKRVDNFIPTTFKPAQNLIKINRIDKKENSTSSFISSNQISFKHKIRNKEVSQFKSKSRQSKDYDYNYYEDISENLSPEYDFIEFKKIK